MSGVTGGATSALVGEEISTLVSGPAEIWNSGGEAQQHVLHLQSTADFPSEKIIFK